jgi:Ca2+-binding RTX toxin-like protein
MADVTVTGGSGRPALTLNYSSTDTAYNNAVALAQFITDSYSTTAAEYYPDPVVGTSPYLVVTNAEATGAVVGGLGFSAITVQNNSGPVTVYGGGSASQTVLAADGGMTFSASSGDTTVVAGGGNNYIKFGSGTNEAITSTGNDTIVSGHGNAQIDAGGGDNLIRTGSGSDTITVEGTDTVYAGSGYDTVQVTGSGSALVKGGTAFGHITFIGGSASSTVRGGNASVTVSGGAGGGTFIGGSSGDNSITGGSGAATILGGGSGDTLTGGSGNALIYAGSGNETLNAGTGKDEFVFKPGRDGGTGSTDQINNFSISEHDKLWVGPFGDSSARDYAIDHQTVSGGNDTILLQDGTKLVLIGVNSELGPNSII